MSNFKTVLRVGGIAVAAIGLMFLPVRNYVFDKRDLSAFHDVAELGEFVQTALALIVVGLVMCGLSFLVHSGRHD